MNTKCMDSNNSKTSDAQDKYINILLYQILAFPLHGKI